MIISMIVFFLIGCFLLLFLMTFIHGSGLIQNMRTVTRSIIISAITMLVVSFFMLFQFFSYDAGSTLYEIVGGTALLMALLVVFDSLFIDLFLRGKIIPLILKVPDSSTIELMKKHVMNTLTFGWFVIIPVVLISSVLSYFVVI